MQLKKIIMQDSEESCFFLQKTIYTFKSQKGAIHALKKGEKGAKKNCWNKKIFSSLEDGMQCRNYFLAQLIVL